MADAVAKTANSIGYVEFIYALQHELNFAAVRNGSGEYVKADLDSVTAAAKAADLRKWEMNFKNRLPMREGSNLPEWRASRGF